MECKRCLMTTDIPDVVLNEKGTCNFCDIHDEHDKKRYSFNFAGVMRRIQKQKRKYHVLLGISGGFDSSLLLEYCVKRWNLNPLVVHFDNGYNTPEANYNIELMVNKLGVEMIRYYVNQKEYDNACLALLRAGVSDADITNDLVMAELLRMTYSKYNIKWHFNGHNYRTEGTSPLCWSYMDDKYLASVYQTHIGNPKNLDIPRFTLWKQLLSGLSGVKYLDPFDYINVNFEKEQERLISQYGWKPYGAKHSENDYTWFVGAHYLPKYFGIDKRITYLSARIRSGAIKKEDARLILQEPVVVSDSLMARVSERVGEDVRKFPDGVINTHYDYDSYHPLFKKYKWLMWVAMKLHLIRYGFYKKYTR